MYVNLLKINTFPFSLYTPRGETMTNSDHEYNMSCKGMDNRQKDTVRVLINMIIHSCLFIGTYSQEDRGCYKPPELGKKTEGRLLHFLVFINFL